MPNSSPPGFESLEDVYLEILDLDPPSSCYVDISSIVTDKITLEHCSNTQILSLVNKQISEDQHCTIKIIATQM